jgi:hypothetical protein
VVSMGFGAAYYHQISVNLVWREFCLTLQSRCSKGKKGVDLKLS